MDSILKYTATLGFIGYSPYAPGTLGSTIAFLIYVVLKPKPFLQFVMLLVIIPIGIVCSHQAERLLRDKDSRHIVIDEFCGYFVSTFMIPFSTSASLLAFFLFRLFDILKPFPIRRIESALSGGVGIMADDIMAAVYTNIILQILVIANPAPFSFFS